MLERLVRTGHIDRSSLVERVQTWPPRFAVTPTER